MSKQAKHTPGPWLLNEDGILVDAEGSKLFSISVAPRCDGGCCGQDEALTWFNDADPCLIVAAPELLAALETNHEWHMQYDERDAYADSELCEKNLAAIAKARGGK